MIIVLLIFIFTYISPFISKSYITFIFWEHMFQLFSATTGILLQKQKEESESLTDDICGGENEVNKIFSEDRDTKKREWRKKTIKGFR